MHVPFSLLADREMCIRDSYKTPYPISIEANGEVINQRTIQVFVPYKYLYLFDEPRTCLLYTSLILNVLRIKERLQNDYICTLKM